MREVIVSGLKRRGNQSGIRVFILNYFILPFWSGILGFSSFLGILTISKYLGYLIGTSNVFKIETGDVTLSILGFVLVFLIKFLENFNTK